MIAIDEKPGIRLTTIERKLIRDLYAQFTEAGIVEVRIIDELIGGYVARVLVVEPWSADGRPQAHQVVKLGPLHKLKAENRLFERHVKHSLPDFAPQKMGFTTVENKAIIAYVYLGENEDRDDEEKLTEPTTLKDYYKTHDEPEILQVLQTLLGRWLGPKWYEFDSRGNRPLRYEDCYSRYFPPDLIIETEQIEPDSFAVAEEYRRFRGDGDVWQLQDYIALDRPLYLEEFKVQEIEENRLTLCHLTEPFRVRTRLTDKQQQHLSCQEGDSLCLQGIVTEFRHNFLMTIVETVFANVNAANSINITSKNVEVANIQLPNPLEVYCKYLRWIMPRNLSLIHGDLHFFNVIIDNFNNPRLIDFGRVEDDGHRLFDFIELEVHLRHAILGDEDYSIEVWIDFEHSLLCQLLPRNRLAVPQDEKLRTAYAVIGEIRQQAQQYAKEKNKFVQEYLPALFLYSLATLKYHQMNGDCSTRHAFLTAAVTAAYLEDALDCQTPIVLPLPEVAEESLRPAPTIVEIARTYADTMKPIPPEAPEFYMAPCLVSNELYYHFVQENREWGRDGMKYQVQAVADNYLRYWRDDPLSAQLKNLPVVYISYQAAAAFAAWLADLTGHDVRLPSQQQWQTAVAAGRTDWLEDDLRNHNVCYREVYNSNLPRAVNVTRANPWGIHDLLGNAFDIYHKDGDYFRVGGSYRSFAPAELRQEIPITDSTECLMDMSFRCVRLLEPGAGELL